MRILTSVGAAAITQQTLQIIVDNFTLKETYATEIATMREVIQALADGKVDAIAGKGLSTNDFTTELKAAVEAIQDKDFYTQSQIDALLQSQMRFLGDLTYAQLQALADMKVGDTYRITDGATGVKPGDKLFWDGSDWESIGSSGGISLDDCEILTAASIDALFAPKPEESGEGDAEGGDSGG